MRRSTTWHIMAAEVTNLPAYQIERNRTKIQSNTNRSSEFGNQTKSNIYFAVSSMMMMIIIILVIITIMIIIIIIIIISIMIMIIIIMWSLYEIIHICTAVVNESEEWSSQWIFQFKQLDRRSLKEIRASTGFEPADLRDTDALPTELWSHTLGARSIYWVHIFPCSETKSNAIELNPIQVCSDSITW